MTPTHLVPMIVAVLASVATAQQTGDPNRDYQVNYNGGFQASYIQHSLCVPADYLNNSYNTLDPSAPVIWAAASSGTVGWFTTATNSVDIGPAGLTFLLDGTFITSTNFINFFAVTDPFGSFYLSLPTSPALAGGTVFLAMAHVAATSPDGFWVSQTHQVTFTGGSGPNILPPSTGTACNGAATPVSLSDDSFSVQNLNASGFPYFGTSWTQAYVGSNGYVTFGAGDTNYVEDAALFASGPPRIAQLWDDMNPGAGGTVSYFADVAGGFEVCFNGVPEFPATGANTFRLIAIAGAFIQMDYDAGMSAADGLVGLSPGNGGTVNPTDLSNPASGGTPIAPGTGLFELFCTPNLDLQGYQVTFFLNGSGTPVSQS